MKTKYGFTLIEATAVITIVGIIASVAVTSSRKFVAQSELQSATLKFLSELQGARPAALKYDAQVMIKFFSDGCSTYVDRNGNGAREAGEALKVYRFPTKISIGIASNGPTAPPTGIDWNASGIAGNWNTAVLTVSNNAIGSVNSGAIFLKSTRLSKITYCIGISSGTRSLQLFKWEGASWIRL